MYQFTKCQIFPTIGNSVGNTTLINAILNLLEVHISINILCCSKSNVLWPTYTTLLAIVMSMFIVVIRFLWQCIILLVEANIWMFLLFVYICIVVRYPIISGVPLSGLIPPHVCVCPKSEPGFTMQCVVVFLYSVIRDERWLFIFVDIGGIVDLHC